MGSQVKLVSQYCEKYLTSHFLKSEHDISKINPSKRLVYGITRDHETQDYAVIEKLEVRCSLCNREWMSSRWCRGCYSDHFESEFKNWTSDDTDIEPLFIGQGGYGTVSKAYWEKGRIYKRDFIENKWERSGPMWVALKSIDEEEGSTAAFLKEAKAMNRCLKNDIRVNRIDRLWSIAIDLRTLHRADLVHRDLHSGKVLFGSDRRSFIADFGLASNRPTAHSLADTLEKWLQIICGKCETKCDDKDIWDQFNLAEQKRQKNPSLIKPYSEELHPSVSLTSRILPKIYLPIQMTSEEKFTIDEFLKDYENNIDENNISMLS
ncbi:5577_t:CDS:2 [Rhizophagus irregularis]|nr:5577_t:CDS:2 [Rhizophagus irregularis]